MWWHWGWNLPCGLVCVLYVDGLCFRVLNVGVCESFVDGESKSWELVYFDLYCRVEGYVLAYTRIFWAPEPDLGGHLV